MSEEGEDAPDAAMPIAVIVAVTVLAFTAAVGVAAANWYRHRQRLKAMDKISATLELKEISVGPPPVSSASVPLGGVIFMTDVEGNWEYFERFVRRSSALSFSGGRPYFAADGTADLLLHDGWRFVFGGDSPDKGGTIGGTVRVVRTLVALKRKYPDRVTLILGNRDLNKMRWTSQLEFKPKSYNKKTGLATWTEWNRLDRVDGPPWVDSAQRTNMTPTAYYRNMLVKAQRHANAEDVSIEELREYDTVLNRIRWHFEEMMGADGEVERRRAELSFLSTLHGGKEATDDDVVQDTINSVREGGFMREFIELGQLAHVDGGVLYVHGGIVGDDIGCSAASGDHAIGRLPGMTERIDDVHAWVEQLNAWKDEQVREWIHEPSWSGTRPPDRSTSSLASSPCQWKTTDGYELRGGGQSLMDYAAAGGQASVVLGRHLLKSGMPMQVPEEAMLMLNRAGVRRLVVGHTPHGTCPTIFKSGGPAMAEPGLLVVMADTSYSDIKSKDCRGRAVSEVQLLDDGQVHVQGVLPDGRGFAYTLPDGVGGEEHPDLIGWDLPAVAGEAPEAALDVEVVRELGGQRFFVKSYLESDHLYMLQHVDGFLNKYVYLRPQEVTRVFQAALSGLRADPTGPLSPLGGHEPRHPALRPPPLITAHPPSGEDVHYTTTASRYAIEQLQERASSLASLTGLPSVLPEGRFC